jgi:hypothetical protein
LEEIGETINYNQLGILRGDNAGNLLEHLFFVILNTGDRFYSSSLLLSSPVPFASSSAS